MRHGVLSFTSYVYLAAMCACNGTAVPDRQRRIADNSAADGLNFIPPGYIDADFDDVKYASLAQQRKDAFNNIPTGAGEEPSLDVSLSEKLKPNWIVQKCKNWCGPAAVQEVLRYKDLDTITQDEIAPKVKNFSCRESWTQQGEFRGTCLTSMITYLSETLKTKYPDALQQYTGLHLKQPLGDGIKQLTGQIVDNVKYRDKPLIVLLSPAPSDVDGALPGWKQYESGTTGGHYATLTGAKGNYDPKKKGSSFVRYRESSGRVSVPKNPSATFGLVDISTMVALIHSKDGVGSCHKDNWNVVY